MDCLFNKAQKKIKPLSLFARNRTEPHDKGITYHSHISTTIMLMSIWVHVRGRARSVVVHGRGALIEAMPFSKVEASSYPRCPRHAHHTVTVRNWLHLYLHDSTSITLMKYLRQSIALAGGIQ
jgi:hypothetical protein